MGHQRFPPTADGTWQNALHGVRGTGVECDIISCSLVGLEMLGACLLKDREVVLVTSQATGGYRR